MKRKIIVVLILLCLVVCLASCESGDECSVVLEEPKEVHRFSYESHYMSSVLCAYIITDTETGVQYLFVDGYNAGGLTVLQEG